MRKDLITASVAAALAAFAEPAAAGPAQSLPADTMGAVSTSVRVDFSDLNIGTIAGARTLLWRIHAASLIVCGNKPGFSDLAGVRVWQRCISGATANAVSEVGSPLVNELYHDKPAPVAVAHN